MVAVSKRIFGFVLILLLSGGLLLQSAPSTRANPTEAPPSLSGTFIQPDLPDGWTDAQLESHMRYLKRAGFQEMVIQWTADSGDRTSIYPSGLPGVTQSTSTDVVGRILATAEDVGLDIHLGLQVNDEWWNTYANDAVWLDAEATFAQDLVDDLWDKYGDSPVIAGWYLSFEVDNFNFPTAASWDAMAGFYDRVISHVRTLQDQPVTISPFYNTAGGLVPDQWQEMWTHILGRTDIDVVALQDGVGAGHASTSELPDWFAATKAAIDEASPGTELWSDTETFNPDFTPMAIKLVAANLAAVEPYVTRYWSFSYDHYDSPLVVSSTYDSTYREYLATGRVEDVAPTAPTGLRVTATGLTSVSLDWGDASDNIGVAGYLVLRDGQVVSRVDGSANCTVFDTDNVGCDVPSAPTTSSDSGLDEGTYHYAVMAFDAAGNESPLSNTVEHTTEGAPLAPVVLSTGADYTCSLAAADGYPDPGTKLTDGVRGSTVFTDPAWTGRLTVTTFDCTVDLGSQQQFDQVTSSWLQEPGVGIVLPNSIDVSISTDGEEFTKVGTMARPGGIDGAAVATYRLVGVEESARWVRLTIHPNTGGWSFTDELEIRAFADDPTQPEPSPSATPTIAPSATPSIAPSATPSIAPSPTPSSSASSSPTASPSAIPGTDLYTTPGFHSVNGRKWFTRCEPYSQTVRCRTEIWATRVVAKGTGFVQSNGWVFNNLTYRADMKRAQWAHNPLGRTGEFTSDGRRWRTECDTAVTGRGGCRSYIEAAVVSANRDAAGSWSYAVVTEWVFNNMVRFRQ